MLAITSRLGLWLIHDPLKDEPQPVAGALTAHDQPMLTRIRNRRKIKSYME
jgi:hypothetical protein